MTLYKPKLLIDECLSPCLADDVRSRGFVCEHVNDIKKKHRAGRMRDGHVVQYALARDLIVATRNLSDFEQIYIAHKMHPGLILLDCPEKVAFTVETQLAMLRFALDGIGDVRGIIASEPLQEAVVVALDEAGEDEFDVTLARYHLPDA